MKNFLLLTIFLVCTYSSFAQSDQQDKNTAMRLVEANKLALGLTSADLNQVIIHTTYQIPSSDIRMVYLQQGYKDIPVYNQMQVLAFRNGKVVSNAGGLLSNMEQRTKNNGGVAGISAIDAVRTAMVDQQIADYMTPQSLTSTDNGRKHEFGKLGVAVEDISAELLWLPLNDGKEVKLVWQVFLAPKKSSDYWLLRVDAASNNVIDRQNLTISCNWDAKDHTVQEHFEKKHYKENNSSILTLQENKKTHQWQYRPFVVDNATYRVIPHPAENPLVAGGAPALRTNPWNWAPGDATSLKWHYDGATYYETTRGNNVWAYEDVDGSNATQGISATSTTVQPDLTLTSTPDFTVAPTTAANQQFNITNLFYWNNLMHDVAYQYGFTEVARNFQANNQGRGGFGADYVLAEAQDGSGSNNANFASAADGTRPRMQMFLWNFNGANPLRDGDVDNGIIAHEYTHGISNRLTGSGSGCLGSSEQMGEGWSDYYALMVTTNWAAATPADGFNIPRPIGLYALSNAALFPSPGNPGIRRYPYSTNMAVNPSVYTTAIPSSPHDRGELWCAVLWDMTWNIINHTGTGINPNIFDPSAGGGNAIALKLVTEGLRLQPCGPGFIDGRNAILRADTLFFGAQYSCDILRAFARRGMGLGASQGSANNLNDQIISFNDGSSFTLTQNAPQAFEGTDIIYTNTVSAACSPMNNFTITDTLPLNVTYVSGGTYNPANRVVSFNPVNVPAGGSQSYSFTVNVNPGSYFPPVIVLNEPVTGPPPAIPAGWTATSTTATNWVVSNTQSNSAPSSLFSANIASVSDQIISTSANVALGATPPALTFWHSYNTESGFDGGVVEISINGGTTWTDLGANMTSGGYNGSISNAWGSPIGGRPAFTGNSGGFVKTTINLTPYANQANVRFRFRFASDQTLGAVGWFVDDIMATAVAVVNMRSTLFDAGMIPVSVRDTITQILPGACTNPAITSQPASVVNCATTGSAAFTVTATGSFPSYQWQVSADGGTTWTDVTGATSATYTIAAPTVALNGNLYRAEVTGLCGAPLTSNAAVLYVSPALTHTDVSATPAAVCSVPGSTSITGTANGGTVSNAVVGSTGLINIPIPDNDPAGLSTSIQLPAMTIQQATNLKLRLNLNHTWTGDVSVTLTSPCGTTFVFDRPGFPAAPNGIAADLSGIYIFDLAAATIIPEVASGVIPTGTYLPSDNSNPGVAHNWAGFTFPCSAAGTWTLNISDNNVTDTGILNEWAILAGGIYTHTLSGPGTITANPPTGTSNSIANYSVSGIAAGNHTYVLTSTDALGCTVASNIAVVVTSAINITTQPVDRIICENGNTTFTVVDNSPLPPTYQWQINQGSGFVNVTNAPPFAGATTSTLTLTSVNTTFSGSTFRLVVTNACGSATSDIVSLTVNPIPVITVGPGGQCAPVTLTATGTSDTYSWSPATGLSATTGASVIASPVSTTLYTVTGTITASGCQNTATVTVLGTPGTPVITPTAPVICAGVITPINVAGIAATYTASGTITMPAGAPGNTAAGIASPYPAVLNITGLPTSGVTVQSVTINGVSHTFPDDLDILLQSPTGTNVVLMSDAGGGNDLVNTNFTFSDGAITALSDGGVNASGTYRPTNYITPDTWVAPGPGAITQATPALSSFGGNPNGNWNLFVVDDAAGDVGSIQSWSITFTVNTAVFTPATGLFTNAAGTTPYVAGTPVSTIYASPAATTTYTVVNTLGTCSSAPATVIVTVNPVPTIAVSPNNQCSPVTLTATGNSNTYSWTPATGLSASTGATVTATPGLNTLYTVTGTITATGCTSSATATVNATPAAPVVTPSPVTMCFNSPTPLTAQIATVTSANGGGIVLPAGAPVNTAAGVGSPYPSVLSIGGLPASGIRVKSVTINGINHTFPDDIDLLLQSPTGTNVVLMSDAGGGNDLVNVNYVFDNAGAIMTDGGVNPSGTYRPVNFGVTDTWVAPGPGAITDANPTLNSFTGNLNGNWNLFAVDDAGGDVGLITSWSITFEVAGAIWTPATGLFSDATGTVPYVAGTPAAVVYANPATSTTYTVTRGNTATCNGLTSTVAVTVVLPITITTQPATQTVCAGATVTFATVTTGTFQNYQWQISTNGGTTWTNITNANNASLVLPNAITAMSGNRYRVIISNSCTTVTSNAAILTVNPLPVLTVNAINNKICISDTSVALVGTPVGGFWSGIGVSGNNFIPTSTAVGTYTLTYNYTSATGCLNRSTVTAKVEDCPERIILLRDNAVILYPNPNDGRFNIRINSTLYNKIGMRVYTTAGQLVRMQDFGGLVYGRVIPIDLTSLPAAVYMVKFYYDDGVRTSEKTFKVIVGR